MEDEVCCIRCNKVHPFVQLPKQFRLCKMSNAIQSLLSTKKCVTRNILLRWAVQHLFSSLTVAKGSVVSMTTSARSFTLFMVAVLGISEVHTSVPCVTDVLTDLLSMNSSMCLLSKKTSASVVSSGSSFQQFAACCVNHSSPSFVKCPQCWLHSLVGAQLPSWILCLLLWVFSRTASGAKELLCGSQSLFNICALPGVLSGQTFLFAITLPRRGGLYLFVYVCFQSRT